MLVLKCGGWCVRCVLRSQDYSGSSRPRNYCGREGLTGVILKSRWKNVISFTIVENPNLTDLQHEAVKGAPFQDPEVSPDVIFTHPIIIMLVRVQKILGNSAFDKN